MKKKSKKKWELSRRGKSWTQQEEALLRKLYPDQFNFELAERFGRTTDALCTKAGQLRLKKNWRKYDPSRFKKGKRWSKEERSRLKKLYPQMPTSQLPKYFPKRSREAIAGQASMLGLRKTYIKQSYSPNYNLWREQKEILAKLYPTTDNKELARLLGRSKAAIQGQAQKLELHKACYIPGEQTGQGERLWTPQEDVRIRKSYPTARTKDFAVQLDRTVDAVITRAARIGVWKDPEKFSRLQSWTEEEIAFLKKYYKTLPAEQIAEKLGDKTPVAVKVKAAKLGLKKTRRSIIVRKKTGMSGQR